MVRFLAGWLAGAPVGIVNSDHHVRPKPVGYKTIDPCFRMLSSSHASADCSKSTLVFLSWPLPILPAAFPVMEETTTRC
ncbi:hypothetical protein LX36DRAFT_663286 [Colletotrichum falcatum]|nr:hypothetical protein LX36DRAFT_663286 [Colletotrichum falcatum]